MFDVTCDFLLFMQMDLPWHNTYTHTHKGKFESGKNKIHIYTYAHKHIHTRSKSQSSCMKHMKIAFCVIKSWVYLRCVRSENWFTLQFYDFIKNYALFCIYLQYRHTRTHTYTQYTQTPTLESAGS